MPEVTKAVNLMQGTAYKINKFILGVMQNAWDKGLSIGGMPPIKNLTYLINHMTLKLIQRHLKSLRRKVLSYIQRITVWYLKGFYMLK